MMRAWERRIFNTLAVVVSTTGLAYLALRYGLQNDDPFALVNHPLEPWALAAHVLAAPWLLVMFGLILNSHIERKMAEPAPTNRRTGLASLIAFVVMTVSGYGLQVVTSPTLTTGLFVSHLVSGGAFVLVYGVHLAIGLRASARCESRRKVA